MEDEQIIRLFFQRSEQAIGELSKQYGKLCFTIAHHILNDSRDAEECVNDAYLAVWNNIPPESPQLLRPYLCRIVRNISLKKLTMNSALKRRGDFEIPLSELAECIPDKGVDDVLCVSELTTQINEFLSTLGKEDRIMFLKRYWFSESLTEIAKTFEITQHNASVRLHRIRGKLYAFLREKEVL